MNSADPTRRELEAPKEFMERMVLKVALEKIAALDAAKDSDEGWNEWGEADCFRKARRIAKKALEDVSIEVRELEARK
jgi:hypothetical protein